MSPKPPPRKDACLADLKSRILSLDLTPGSDLDEATISTAYGLSRTPLREVFQRLAGEGYLTLAPNRGAIVSPMDLAVMRSFFQTAPIIYCAISRLAATQATPAQIAALKDAQQAFRQAKSTGDAGDMALMNHRFHECIGTMAANPYLMPSLNRLLIDHTRMSRTFYRADSPDDGTRIDTAADQHDRLIAAIAAHDAELAVELTLDHWALSRDQIERYVWPEPLPDDAQTLTNGAAR